jgi:hypothetical protein
MVTKGGSEHEACPLPSSRLGDDDAHCVTAFSSATQSERYTCRGLVPPFFFADHLNSKEVSALRLIQHECWIGVVKLFFSMLQTRYPSLANLQFATNNKLHQVDVFGSVINRCFTDDYIPRLISNPWSYSISSVKIQVSGAAEAGRFAPKKCSSKLRTKVLYVFLINRICKHTPPRTRYE